MKKYGKFVLVILLFMGMCQGIAFAENGGTENQPQLISTIEQLRHKRVESHAVPRADFPVCYVKNT